MPKFRSPGISMARDMVLARHVVRETEISPFESKEGRLQSHFFFSILCA